MYWRKGWSSGEGKVELVYWGRMGGWRCYIEKKWVKECNGGVGVGGCGMVGWLRLDGLWVGWVGRRMKRWEMKSRAVAQHLFQTINEQIKSNKNKTKINLKEKF